MIQTLSQLLRWRLALLNGIATSAGYLFFPAAVNVTSLLTVACATALLAAGGSALNQVLEKESDRLMERTRNRPLPSGSLQSGMAICVGLACVAAGSMILLLQGSMVAVLIGILALVWYLVVYTPMKPRTSLALPVGAVCGAAPPLIGWLVAGGGLSDHRIILVAGVMFLWQIPHFWLLQRRYREDYLRARMPVFDTVGTHEKTLHGLWMAALVVAALMLPFFGVVAHNQAFLYLMLLFPLIPLAIMRRDGMLFRCMNLLPLLLAVSAGWS